MQPFKRNFANPITELQEYSEIFERKSICRPHRRQSEKPHSKKTGGIDMYVDTYVEL